MITAILTGRIRVANNLRVNEPVKVSLRFDKREPLHVTVTFQEEHQSEPSVEWVVSRELMIKGSESPFAAGTGDFRVMRSPGGFEVGFCLRSDEGHADVAVPHVLLTAFLDRTRAECALNSHDEEQIIADALDEFLAEVMDG
jgi:hypothetical protein